MRRLLPFKLLALSCLLAACVTVNVYFPAAAAEQAADRIIDTVTSHSQQKSNENSTPKSPPQSRVAPVGGQAMLAATPTRVEQPLLLATAGALLNFLIPA